MDERIRLIVEAQNRASPVIQAVKNGLEGMATAAKGAGTATSNAAGNIRSAMTNVGNAVNRAGAVFQAFSRTAHSAISAVLTPLGSLTKGLSIAGSLLGGFSIAAFTRAGIDMNLTVDRATAALTKMTGSAQVASTFVEALRKEAETSAPTLAELLPIAQQLAAAYGPAGLGKVIPTIRAFGDAAVSLGAGTDGMQLALLGFRQMLGRDFPQQEELNQIRENLPGLDVNGILKRSFGTADTEMLKDAGVTGQMVGAAIVAGMQQAFGGAQAEGAMKLPTLLSNFQDTFSRAAGNITLGFLRSLEGTNGAVTKLLGSFQRLADSQNFMGAITVVFDGLGRALEAFSSQGDKFVDWLDAVFSREGVAILLSNILGLVQTIGQSIAKTFGVDLKAAMDPKNVMVFFDALAIAADQGISTFFGIGRVAVEVVRIAMSAFEDMGDRVSDIVSDVSRGFKGMFLSLQISMAEMTGAFMDNVSKMLEALSKVGIGAWKPFGELHGAAESMAFQAAVINDPKYGTVAGLKGQQQSLLGERVTAEAERSQRTRQRLADDPYRNDPFFKRIGDAFSGRPGQQGAEDSFRALFEQNRLGIAKALFAGAGASAPSVPFPAAPMLYGGGGGGASVQTVRSNTPAIPSLPDYMTGGYSPSGDAWTDAYIRQRDGGGGNSYTFAPVVQAPDRATLQRMFDEWYDALTRQGIAGPSPF